MNLGKGKKSPRKALAKTVLMSLVHSRMKKATRACPADTKIRV